MPFGIFCLFLVVSPSQPSILKMSRPDSIISDWNPRGFGRYSHSWHTLISLQSYKTEICRTAFPAFQEPTATHVFSTKTGINRAKLRRAMYSVGMLQRIPWKAQREIRCEIRMALGHPNLGLCTDYDPKNFPSFSWILASGPILTKHPWLSWWILVSLKDFQGQWKSPMGPVL